MGVLPYLFPPDSAVDASPWRLLHGDDSAELSGSVDGWAPGNDIRLRRTIDVDEAAVRMSSRTGTESELLLTVSWYSLTSKAGGVLLRCPCTGASHAIDVTLSGDRIGGIVVLKTTLTVKPSGDIVPGAANRTGSTLWADEHQLNLDAEGDELPVYVHNFSDSPHFDPSASWHVEYIRSGLEMSFNSSILVHVNLQDEKLAKACSAVKPNREQTLLIDVFRQSITQELLLLALAEVATATDAEQLLPSDKWEEGSVGFAFAYLLEEAGLTGVNLTDNPFDLPDVLARTRGGARRTGKGYSFS